MQSPVFVKDIEMLLPSLPLFYTNVMKDEKLHVTRYLSYLKYELCT